jgi:iron complex transport system ATP-binding protein
MRAPLIETRGVSFTYGRGRSARPVLEGVSLEIAAGSIVGLLGPNGSGKTTLLKLMAGVLEPVSGTVLLDGRPLREVSRLGRARRVAMVAQENRAAFDFTVLDIVLMGRYPHLGTFELEGPDDLRVARSALEATGTAELATRRFATLSGGEQQRVVIASALAQASELLLLDEPTTALDLRYQFEVADVLRRLNAKRGTTLVVSTHDLTLASALCAHVIMLKDGRVMAYGPTNDVLTAGSVRRLYGVEADVRFDDRAGRLTVVPLGRAE